jgi:cellulose synthase/poly-beta-1,6-N-acetylglucosamine synthase-like glycosyltransferase
VLSTLSLVLAWLYAAAMVVLGVFGLNLLWMAWRTRRDGAPEALPEAEWEEDEWPAVLVQLPLYNERTVAERVVDACARLTYPGRITLQVLDDSTDETQALVAGRVAFWQDRGVDVHHVRRPTRQGYKAGALAYGLRHPSAEGTELVGVLDADFVPPPDLFARLATPFADPEVALVQARWGHLNRDRSALTRVQAALLDNHFAVEQRTRAAAGCFMSFNGTAGLWRQSAIADAGGWQADTLTEDLDLSYRAQLDGWRFVYAGRVEVPAELPETAAAWRQQQHRWTKGTAETARKLLGRLLRSDAPARVKLEGALHLGSTIVFPALLTAALLHAPLLALHPAGHGPGDGYFDALALGLIPFAGFFLSQVEAHRAIYGDARRVLLRFPLLAAVSLGLAVTGTRAGLEAWRGKRTAFIRTPKRGDGRQARYAVKKRAGWWVPWAEAALAFYGVIGFAAVAVSGEWAALPFQAMFTVGFGWLAWEDLGRRFRPDPVPVPLESRPVPAPIYQEREAEVAA